MVRAREGTGAGGPLVSPVLQRRRRRASTRGHSSRLHTSAPYFHRYNWIAILGLSVILSICSIAAAANVRLLASSRLATARERTRVRRPRSGGIEQARALPAALARARRAASHALSHSQSGNTDYTFIVIYMMLLLIAYCAGGTMIVRNVRRRESRCGRALRSCLGRLPLC